jgi:hypothetical protein
VLELWIAAVLHSHLLHVHADVRLLRYGVSYSLHGEAASCVLDSM